MTATIDDHRAREALLGAVRSGNGVSVAKETCAIVTAKKDNIVKQVCQECCSLCSPAHCMYMIEMLTRKTSSSKQSRGIECEWIADGVATVVAGARAVQVGQERSCSVALSGTPDRKHARICQMIGAIEKGAVRVGMRADTRIGAREDPRFAQMLGKLPTKLDEKWNPVLSLVDVAYKFNVPQIPLIKNERFRDLVREAKGVPVSGVASPTASASRASKPRSDSHTRVNRSAKQSGRSNICASSENDSQLKLAAFWTFDRSSMPTKAPDDVCVDPAPNVNDPERVVHCTVDTKRGSRRGVKRSEAVTCVLIDNER